MAEQELVATIRKKLCGHYNYYGVSDNARGIGAYFGIVQRLTLKWRNRRSQMKRVLGSLESLSVWVSGIFSTISTSSRGD